MPLGRRRGEREEQAAAPVRSALPLSIVVSVGDRADAADRLLGALRGHARELLVFADTALSDPELALLQAAAPERLVRVPLDEPRERALAFMLAQASSEWILWLDADEIPSAALLDALPSLLADDRHMAFAPRQAWLFPDAGSALTQRPWAPRAEPRLLRNLPALWRVPGTLHGGVEVAGPVRALDEPLWVTTPVAVALDARRARLAEREALLDGKAEFERERDLLVPEDSKAPATTEPVDARERELIAAVLDGPAREAVAPLRGLPQTIGQAEVDARWAARPPGDGFYSARIEVADHDHRFYPGEQRRFHVLVCNEGDSTWPWGGFASSPELRLTYRWLAPGGADVVPDGARTPLPGPVGPGERVIVGVGVQAPAETGPHTLEIDMVHEGVRWFRAAVRVPIEVS